MSKFKDEAVFEPYLSYKQNFGPNNAAGYGQRGSWGNTDRGIGPNNNVVVFGSEEKWRNGLKVSKTTDSVVRPCHASFEECIRQYFYQNAKCMEYPGHVPDPLVRPVSRSYLSRGNLTLSATNVIYSGLNGQVVDFYVDKHTDKLVIIIQFRNVKVFSKNAYYVFHRYGKNPVINVDYLLADLGSVFTTTVIPCIGDLQFDKSETCAVIEDKNSKLIFGPKAFDTTDPKVQARSLKLMDNMQNNVQDFLLSEASFLAASYIQHKLCDFGVQIP